MSQLVYRQGDVFFREVADLPQDARPSDERVLARGEHSDHSHVVYGRAAKVYYSEEGAMFVDTREGAAVIRHVLESRHHKGEQQWTGEHRTLFLPKGKIYTVRQQSQYDPYTGKKWIVGD